MTFANTQTEPGKFIHLLYAPTNFCNMGCKYCYLGTGTDELTQKDKIVSTLKFTLSQFLKDNTLPFNLSFHGGEATAIPKTILRQLLQVASEHYQKYGATIKQFGYPLNPIHIKTNLYNFDQLYDLFTEYQVSVSASVDLPLKLHEKYRTDKKGKSTLAKITSNLKLLAEYPYHKKISCVVTQEHLKYLDEFIADIKFIHQDIGLDMTKFNVMFSFDSEKNTEKFSEQYPGTEMLTQEQQVFFYQTLKKAFKGSSLELGFKEHWFKEFTPEFCCSAVNCGDKFFLLQSNGDVFACPRGQSSRKFFYGNVFQESVSSIQNNGWQTIESIENTLDADEECFSCHYIPYCNQGCVFVREQTGLKKSYTCKLQKEIYKDNPERYPAYSDDYVKNYAKEYKYRNNLKSFKAHEIETLKTTNVTPELELENNSLAALVKEDSILSSIYDDTLISLEVDGVDFQLRSPVLSNIADIIAMDSNSSAVLKVHHNIFDINCKEPVTNTLHIMLLRNTMVSYGDEKREKQEHIADYSIYTNSLISQSEKVEDFYHFDLRPFFSQHRGLFLDGVRNNLFVTTRKMREYHYEKQKKNAFYHIQAINLPFPYVEFYWKDVPVELIDVKTFYPEKD
ncbi:radical SAM protein [Aliikangiella coralliicola]|uniref:Radical SAM protein n=1 Tax=Aliikangiella coralliicola TaxID=2592383 RepID=A0A545TV40_9GAMM|nr:SPASM domain-containing protein [Aliikangiella coralliicola]TQV81079.1 radical SAM protein [Aliikangiella coralliicola]